MCALRFGASFRCLYSRSTGSFAAARSERRMSFQGRVVEVHEVQTRRSAAAKLNGCCPARSRTHRLGHKWPSTKVRFAHACPSLAMTAGEVALRLWHAGLFTVRLSSRSGIATGAFYRGGTDSVRTDIEFIEQHVAPSVPRLLSMVGCGDASLGGGHRLLTLQVNTHVTRTLQCHSHSRRQ